VRAIIPPIVQRNLTIEPDQSNDAKDVARRSPPERAADHIHYCWAIAVPVALQMIREALRQTYYGA